MSNEKISSKRTPIYRDAGFLFNNIAEAEQAFKKEGDEPQSSERFIYTRYGNPTVVATEEAIAKLEGSKWALLTASGMAAIDVALSIFQEDRDERPWLFFSELYGGTNFYIHEVLKKRRGIRVEQHKPENDRIENGKDRFDLDTLDDLLESLKPKLLFFEPISNPLLIAVDGRDVIKRAKKHGVKTVVDNTFATPYLWKPLASDADIVVHSATKYLSGHGNVTAGVVAGKDLKLKADALLYRKLVGHILNADEAYRLGTQIKTFDLRYARQCKNALTLARKLEEHKNRHHVVKRVRYPGLDKHDTHEEARQLFKEQNYGAMITFELTGGKTACDYFVERVSEHISYVPTLGDAESIMLHVATVFKKYDAAADEGRGKFNSYDFPGMIRLSVGFEPYEELEKVVLDALDALAVEEAAIALKTH